MKRRRQGKQRTLACAGCVWLRKKNVQTKPEGEIENHADHRSGDGLEGVIDVGIASQLFDVRRAKENPKKAGHEGSRGGETSAERRGREGRQCPRMIPPAEKPNKLHDHNEWSRRGLRESQA